MRLRSRALMIAAWILIVLTAACNLPAGTPTAVGTILPTEAAITTSPTVPASTQTPNTVIPVTGAQDVSLQCQFCVNGEPHAVLILPVNAAFLVAQPVVGVNCITAQLVDDKRILFCRGAQKTLFNLNVCFDASNCLQYPITLATCPLAASGNPTPVVLVPSNPGVTATAAATEFISSPTSAPQATATLPPPTFTSTPAVASTPVPLPTLTVPPAASPAVTATLHAPQSRIPSTRLPRTTLNTPEGFLRYYFSAVWNERNYQDLWDHYLTPAFKARPNNGGFEEYVTWWDSVQRVDVNSVSVLQNDGTHAWVRVNVTFTMKDGRVVSNQEYDYDLLFDPSRQTWMFDYRTPAGSTPTP